MYFALALSSIPYTCYVPHQSLFTFTHIINQSYLIFSLTAIKEKLSGSRPFYPPTQYRASPPPPSFQTHPYPRGNLTSLHSYPRQPFPPRGHAGGYRRGGQPEYFRYQPQYRPPFQPPIRFPPSNVSVSPSRPLS